MLNLKDNKQVLSKAAITTGSFTSEIGLSVQEADRFIDFVIDESGLKDRARLVRMNKRTQKIDKLLLSTDNPLKPGVEATDPGETANITSSQVLLAASEVVAVVRISDDAMEDNLEGDAFADHLMGMIARASANQFEDALLYGRKLAAGTPTDVVQLWDGWMNQAASNGNVVDASGADFSDRFIEKLKMSALIKAMPTKFRKNKRNMNFTLADDIDQDWADLVLNGRATPLGDSSLQGDSPHMYRGVRFTPSGLVRTDRPVVVSGGATEALSGAEPAGETVLAVASTTGFTVGDEVVIARGLANESTGTIESIQTDTSLTLEAGIQFAMAGGELIEEATLDGTDVLFADYRNLILGIQREMTVEPDRLPRLRATDWVVSMRADAKVEEASALAILTNAKVK